MFLPSSSPLAERTWPSWLPSFSEGGGDNSEDDMQNWSAMIGIITAICGNVLIALALNVQRYAHIRLHRRKSAVRERARQALKNATCQARGQGQRGGYGAAETSDGGSNGSRIIPNGSGPRHGDHDRDEEEEEQVRDSYETDPLTQSFRSDDSRWTTESSESDEAKVPSTYLKDPYWWLGQVLITVGEMGNFLAYGFAPASIVSPLGVVALVSNCVIAPIFFKEVFRHRDFWGVIIAIGGAVTVVLSAKTEETKLGPHEVWEAITTMEFEIYVGVSCGLIALLMYLSPRYGNRTILIDLGLVGLFGGYTALSTKGVSSMLSSTLLGAFTTPVTYGLIFVLLFTAIMQVRFLNKALQRFDSTQVIPIQFVLFTLSVIIGSAVLYRDFERTTAEQAAKFIGGCLLTFFGVFLITSGRPQHDDEEEATLSDAEGIEETIGLAEQEPATGGSTALARQSTRRGSDSAARSARSSRVSFKEGFTKLRPAQIPSQKPALLDEEDDCEDAPLLGPWRDGTPPRPSFGPHMISSDSVPSVVPSAAVSDTEQPVDQFTTVTTTIIGTTPPPPGANRPTTPKAPGTAGRLTVAHYSAGPVISPSPFSSTLGAVVADKLLAHIDGTHGSPTQALSAARRNRPSLRNSLFVPQEEADDLEAQFTVSAVESRDHGARHHLFGHDGEQQHVTGFRGRARSLSHTLGELLGVGLRGMRREDEGDDGDGAALARARTALGTRRDGVNSTENF
ncbi:magnesium transporter NIPA-domain-containing protein [Podospora australis]|uniref:Magnesium transporter NIPA-domain-containing protein n=1 Tax=Podospora australis TaxID=1536484 RepID=A0AAN6X5Y4_9PEZI|nr:magnesium transporter NIPA-domain-containing protein [Podospora australis]